MGSTGLSVGSALSTLPEGCDSEVRVPRAPHGPGTTERRPRTVWSESGALYGVGCSDDASERAEDGSGADDLEGDRELHI